MVRSARPQVEAWSADRCVAACHWQAECLREACHARNARAAVCLWAASWVWSSEPRSGERAASDAQATEEEAVAAARASAQRQAAAVPLALQAAVAAVAAGHAAAEAVAQHAAGAEEAAVVGPASAPEVVAAAELQVVRGQRAAQPSAAPSAFHRGRVLPWPAPPRAARFAHAMERSQIASPSGRWWQAAGGEVGSWWSRSPKMSFGFSACDSRRVIQCWAMNEQGLGWIVAGVERGTGFISYREHAKTPLFMAHSGACFKPSVPIVPHAIRRGVGCSRSVRAARRYLVGRLSRQLLRPRRFAGLMDRWRNLGARAAWRVLPRRLGRLARRCRWYFGRLDRHGRCSR